MAAVLKVGSKVSFTVTARGKNDKYTGKIKSFTDSRSQVEVVLGDGKTKRVFNPRTSSLLAA